MFGRLKGRNHHLLCLRRFQLPQGLDSRLPDELIGVLLGSLHQDGHSLWITEDSQSVGRFAPHIGALVDLNQNHEGLDRSRLFDLHQNRKGLLALFHLCCLQVAQQVVGRGPAAGKDGRKGEQAAKTHRPLQERTLGVHRARTSL